MELLYMTKNGRIEHFSGSKFQSVEPVFILSLIYNDNSELNVLNPYERHYIGYSSRKFEIQPHMFTMKDITFEPVYLAEFEYLHLQIAIRDGNHFVKINWLSDAPEEYVLDSPSSEYFVVDGGYLTPKSVGTIELRLIVGGNIIATCVVEVIE